MRNIFDYYFKCVYKLRFCIIGFWLLMLIFGVIFGFKFLNYTALDIFATAPAQSYEAKELMLHSFPLYSENSDLVIYFHNKNRETVLDLKCLSNVSENLKSFILDEQKRQNRQILEDDEILGYYLTNNSLIRGRFISENQNGTLLMAQLLATGQQEFDDFDLFSKHTKDFVDQYCNSSEKDDMTYGLVGVPKMLNDIRNNVMIDLLHMDMVCLPIAFVVLLIVLKSVRVIFVTMLCWITSVTTSFLIMYPFARYLLDIATFAPSVMMSLCLAIGIDYSLFMFSRFRTELLKGVSTLRAARLTTQFSGRIILLSGFILTVCLSGNLFLPVNMIKTLGLCSAVAALTNMVVNITYIPALLSAFPFVFNGFSYWGFGEFWSKLDCCSSGFWKFLGIEPFENEKMSYLLMNDNAYSPVPSDGRNTPVENTSGSDAHYSSVPSSSITVTNTNTSSSFSSPSSTLTKPLIEYPSLSQSPSKPLIQGLNQDAASPVKSPPPLSSPELYAYLDQRQRHSWWFQLARFTVRPQVSVLLIILIFGACSPFAYYYFARMEQSLDRRQVLAEGSDAVTVYDQLQKDFPPGVVNPCNFVVDANDLKDKSVITNFTFVLINDFIQELMRNFTNDFSPTFVMGVVFSNISTPGDTIFQMFDIGQKLDWECPTVVSEECEALQQLHRNYVSADEAAMYVQFGTLSDPLGQASFNLYPKLLDFTEDYFNNYNSTHLPGGGGAEGASLLDLPKLPKLYVPSMSETGLRHSEIFQRLRARREWDAAVHRRKEALEAAYAANNTNGSEGEDGRVGKTYPYKTPQGYRVGWDGQSFQMDDVVIKVYQYLYPAVGVSLAVVFIILFIMFFSVLIPTRTILTLTVTLFTVYGLLSLLVQNHLLDWMVPKMEHADCLYFFVPVFGYSVIIGLGLDYDIFLFYRILEYRDMGYKDKAAVIKGTSRSGGIITAAGMIMAIAFSGLVMSSMNVLVEFGFMLIFAVLLDTFIVRVFLVPSLVSLLGKANWWPRKKVVATKDEFDVSDEVDELQHEEISEWNQYMGLKGGENERWPCVGKYGF